MASPLLPHRIPRAVRVGEKVAFSRTLTEADAALFIGVTWDVNPYHTDDAYVAQTRFGRRIVPGLLTAESEVVEVSDKGWVRLAGRVIGPDGTDVLRATIRGYPGRFEER